MTRRETRLIRAWWPHLELRFRADGRAWARPKGTRGAWGVLYDRGALDRHLHALRA